MSLLRQGVLLDHSGLMIRESGQARLHTAGTAASATTNTAGYAVGATVIALASAGTGTFVAGDSITFAGDANQYVVAGGTLTSAGTLIIAAPGLKVAMSAATKAITVIAATTRNMFFHRNAIQLLTRAPAMPEGGDCADDVMVITDPVSGIAFEFCVYKQKRQVRYEVNLAWGVGVVQPAHIGLLIGA
jgi:hypothetical protein